MMKNLVLRFSMVILLLTTASAHAGVIINGGAIFDDADDFLQLGGTFTSSNVDIYEILFDWDGGLDNFDFSGSSLVSSNIGGSLTTPASGFNSGSLSLSGFLGAPLAPPASFDFLFHIPGAGAAFLATPIDFYTRDNSGGSDFTNAAFITPTAGDLSRASVPAPATLALFGLGLAGLGWSRRKKA